jgi:hypothetical protein
MKSYWEMEVTSLTSTVDEYEWSASRRSGFNSGERAPLCIEKEVGCDLGLVENRNISV